MQPCLSNYTIPRVVQLKTIVLYCRRNARFSVHTIPPKKFSECAARFLIHPRDPPWYVTLVLGNLSKLTRRPRGGGHIQISIQLRVINVRGRLKSLGLESFLLNRNLLVDRRRVDLLKFPTDDFPRGY